MSDLSTVETIFSAAAALDDRCQRTAYLDGACRGDRALRAAVDRLLAAQSDLGRFLEPAQLPVDFGTGEYPDRRSGATLAGRYRLQEVIGEGGMGSVWAAQQTEPVRRPVAVKLVKSGMDSKAVLARFEAERQALALMEHPNIAKVFDAGTTDDGRPFFVMELVKGVPITWFCDNRRLDLRARLELFVPVCAAIQHAHQKGVIHRDVKPSNVLIATGDGGPVPKVIDFGLAKATGPVLTNQTLATGFGVVVGTAEYMSPEQATLNNLDVDTRVDVYSLGVLLYELLTGYTPLSSAGTGGVLELLRAVREDEPPRPSQKLAAALPVVATARGTDPRRLAAQLCGELDWIVMKALEKDRNRRYDSAEALAGDVRRYLAGEPIAAAPPGMGYRARKFLRRRRGPVLAAGAVVLALVAGLVGTTWGMLRADRERAAAVRAMDEERRARQAETEAAADASERAADTADALQFLQDRVLANARPRGESGGLGRDTTILAGLEAAEPHVTGTFAGRPGVEAAVRDAIGTTYWHLGEYALAATQHERALALRRLTLGLDHPETLATARSLASAWFYLSGRLSDAIALEEDILRRREATLGAGHPDTEDVRGNLALSYYHAGRRAESLATADRAYHLLEVSRGPDDRNTLSAGAALAVPLSEVRPTSETALFLGELLPRVERVLGPDARDTQMARDRLAQVLAHLGRHAEAVPLWEQVLDRWARTGAADHTQTFEPRHRLALSYRAVGRRADALRVYEQLIPVVRARLGSGGWEKEVTAEWIATLFEDGQFDRAADEGRRLLTTERQTGLRPVLDVGFAMWRIGAAELGVGRPDRAEPVLRECLTIRERSQPDDWGTFATRALLGRSLAVAGKYADAEQLLLSGYEGLKQREETIHAGDRGRLPEAADWLIELYGAWGKPADAAKWRAERAKYPPPQAPMPHVAPR